MPSGKSFCRIVDAGAASVLFVPSTARETVPAEAGRTPLLYAVVTPESVPYGRCRSSVYVSSAGR